MVSGGNGSTTKTTRRVRWTIGSLAAASLVFGALAAGLGNLQASQVVVVGLPFVFTLLAGITYELRSRFQRRHDAAESKAQVRIDAAKELHKLVRYWGPVRDADPVELGVSPSSIADRQAEGSTNTRPTYVGRAVDQEIESCLDGTARSASDVQGLALLLGPSKSGKSRAAFEVITHKFGDRILVMPDPNNLATSNIDRVLELLPQDDARRGIVLWLDELDRYLDAGCVDNTRLARWHRQLPGLLVVATLRGDLYPRYQETQGTGDAVRRKFSDAADVLRGATVFWFSASWDLEDWERAVDAYPELRLHGQRERGLGVELISGPDLLRRFQVAESSSPAGFAITCAAIDWRRCGAPRAIRKDELRGLAGQYFWRQRQQPMNDDVYGKALEWALEPVLPGASISLLQFADDRGDTFEAVDYVVAYRDGADGTAVIPESLLHETWDWIIGALTDDECFSVGFAAFRQGFREEEKIAFSRSARSASPATAARSLYRLAQNRKDVGESQQARDLFDQIIDGFGESTDPDVMHEVAIACHAKGLSLGDDGQYDEAIAVYDEMVRRYGTSEDLTLLAEVAAVMATRGLYLSYVGRHNEAIAALNEVIDRYGSATEPFIDKAAQSLLWRGNVLEEAGHPIEAISTYDEMISRFGSSPYIMPKAFATVARVDREQLLGVGHRLRHALFPTGAVAATGSVRPVAFIILLTDEIQATGLARLLKDLSLPEAEERALFVAPMDRSTTFLANPDIEWWTENVPADAGTAYLLWHEESLPEIVKHLSSICYIGFPGEPGELAQLGYVARDNLRLFRSDDVLAFASIVMADFSDPDSHPYLFQRSEAILMAQLAASPIFVYETNATNSTNEILCRD
jgi:tetratricopeptide (TPR) repeat protein